MTLRPSRLGTVVLRGSLSSSVDKSLINILNRSGDLGIGCPCSVPTSTLMAAETFLISFIRVVELLYMF